MRILFIGDVFGRPGRQVLRDWVPRYRNEHKVDFVIANAENSAGGKGITPSTVDELFGCEIDVLTGGNHTWAQRNSYDLLDQDERVLRPANVSPEMPGRGVGIYESPAGTKIGVINLMGRAFMRGFDCPFRIGRRLVEEVREQTPLIVVDFHAEATSEKIGMAAHLDGLVSAVIGTHTHVPTADARISPAGTAAITDVGMTGPYDSVIGVKTSIVLDQLIVGLPVRHEVATDDVRVCALLMDVDAKTGRTQRVAAVRDPEFPRENNGSQSGAGTDANVNSERRRARDR